MTWSLSIRALGLYSKPVPSAKVSIRSERFSGVRAARTDEDGWANFTFPEIEDAARVYIFDVWINNYHVEGFRPAFNSARWTFYI